MKTPIQVVQEQINDDGLWFIARTAPEAYLQQELRRLHAAVEMAQPDPRDPDHSRPGIFAYHNCSRCDDGKRPCKQGNPRQCEFPIARND